jgi:hypothetical protein
VVNTLVKVLRIASVVICLIVIASFIVFAVDQTSSAASRQREALSERTAAGHASAHHENPFHEALDEAASALTAPFAGVVSASRSEWADKGVRVLLALLVYGFGLGYLARAIRVRV